MKQNLTSPLCTSQSKPRPPDPRDIAGGVTFLQCYISTFTPALGGIWTVTIPALRAPVSKARRALPSRGVWGHAPPENFEILYSQRRIFLHSERPFGFAFYLGKPNKVTNCHAFNKSRCMSSLVFEYSMFFIRVSNLLLKIVTSFFNISLPAKY